MTPSQVNTAYARAQEVRRMPSDAQAPFSTP
jgi:hypothetical protein